MDLQQSPTVSPEPPAAAPPASDARRKRGLQWRGGPSLRTIGAILVVALIAAVWLDMRSQLHELQQEIIRKLAEADGYNKETRQIASRAADTVRDMEYRTGGIESRLAETQNQRLALESLYLELNRSRDERVLAEVEQILIIGSQQLTLAGNVKAALIALESAESRLERTDSAQFTALRRAIRRDIERLKATPYVDVVGMSLRLDTLAHDVDRLPLVIQERAMQEKPAAASPQSGWFGRLTKEAWQEVTALIRIQRVDKEEPPVISPSQTYFLRENLRMRLMSARVALLAHEEDSFKADTREAAAWLQHYFDASDAKVAQGLATLKQLAAADVTIEVPDISGSLEAVRNAKLVRERGLR
ncbi:MAG TPA: uroporphyrinogen-III C-methyltransferase [Burkholderiales bacterium]|nr:uroporphyrinogen-III C-methyltransferase [Burkholderiales bacterium]